MALPRVLEAEVMDSPVEARDYDAMDHREVNRRFVDDLLAYQASSLDGVDVLDLGTGTAQIPIELCRRCGARVWGIDLAESMLEVARRQVERAGLSGLITLERVDAKGLPYDPGRFAVVISNSIVHHIPQPFVVFQEIVRVTAPGGTIFVRDLLRPVDRPSLDRLVTQYAAGANEHQRQMFADSLHAALTLDEVRALVEPLGFEGPGVQATSDRHWTWQTRKPVGA